MGRQEQISAETELVWEYKEVQRYGSVKKCKDRGCEEVLRYGGVKIVLVKNKHLLNSS